MFLNNNARPSGGGFPKADPPEALSSRVDSENDQVCLAENENDRLPVHSCLSFFIKSGLTSRARSCLSRFRSACQKVCTLVRRSVPRDRDPRFSGQRPLAAELCVSVAGKGSGATHPAPHEACCLLGAGWRPQPALPLPDHQGARPGILVAQEMPPCQKSREEV